MTDPRWSLAEPFPEWAKGVHLTDVLVDVLEERLAQDAKWGADRDIPNGTGIPLSDPNQTWSLDPDVQRARTARSGARGLGVWADILVEEVAEALAESDPALLRAELIQVAAVAVAWIENLDRRGTA